MLKNMEKRKITSELLSGDLAQIIGYHAHYYHDKYQWNVEFEAYVAKPLAEFALGQNPRERIWLIKEEGTIKGCIALVENSPYQCQLRWFYVWSELRGQGWGRTLLEGCLAFARQENYKKMILWTVDDVDQYRAISLYKRVGFTLVEEVPHQLWGKDIVEQKYQLLL